nr:riboflavin biosynthesis protein RibF [uncultured Dethiosulfovibrio sp.]
MIIVLGAFDGYHRGHQKLFYAAKAMSDLYGTGWSVVSFTPHPKMVLFNERISLLFSADEKRILEAILDVPSVLSLPFTSELASMEPFDFFSYIYSELPLSGVVVGYDFRFGKERKGDTSTIKDLCLERGIPCQVIPPFEIDGDIVSSTSIRDLVSRGKVEKAEKLLGYPFFMEGVVTSGKCRGRELGFPTANISVPSFKAIPAPGVYAGSVMVSDKWLPVAISVGRNPTFGDIDDNKIEVHLIDYSGDLYGRDLIVVFLGRLRQMYRFPDPKALISQIKTDVCRSREIFAKKNGSITLFKKPSVLNLLTDRGMIPCVRDAGL